MSYRPLELVALDVTRKDIENMYDRYDSGMSDRTTANAVCLALQRKLRSQYHPNIHTATRHHGCRLKIESEYFALPSNIYWWLDQANNGGVVNPISFVIALPEEFLKAEAVAKDAPAATIAA